MATGTLTVSVTIPQNNALDASAVGRNIAVQALTQAAQAIGSGQISGNLTYPPGGSTPTVIGTFSFVAGT